MHKVAVVAAATEAAGAAAADNAAVVGVAAALNAAVVVVGVAATLNAVVGGAVVLNAVAAAVAGEVPEFNGGAINGGDLLDQCAVRHVAEAAWSASLRQVRAAMRVGDAPQARRSREPRGDQAARIVRSVVPTVRTSGVATGCVIVVATAETGFERATGDATEISATAIFEMGVEETGAETGIAMEAIAMAGSIPAGTVAGDAGTTAGGAATGAGTTTATVPGGVVMADLAVAPDWG